MSSQLPKSKNMPGMKTYLHWNSETRMWSTYYVPVGYEICFTCDGEGQINEKVCPSCKGKVFVPESEV